MLTASNNQRLELYLISANLPHVGSTSTWRCIVCHMTERLLDMFFIFKMSLAEN